MLSNFVITQQRFVLIIDELGLDENAPRFLAQLLKEQGQDKIKHLLFSNKLKEKETFNEFLNECNNGLDYNWNIILPTLSDLLGYQRPAIIFDFLNKLLKCAKIQRILLWASTQHIMHNDATYIVAGLEYLSDLVVHLETSTELTIVTRKPRGGVTNKRYSYERAMNEFTIEAVKGSSSFATSTADDNDQSEINQQNTENVGTFKIELEEEELVARNALKLPYEKTSENAEGSIIYTPDANDDYDDEDPDDDLCI